MIEPTSHTQRLLQRAAELDPEAWATPQRSKLQARRNRSYQDAITEAGNDQQLPRSAVGQGRPPA